MKILPCGCSFTAESLCLCKVHFAGPKLLEACQAACAVLFARTLSSDPLTTATALEMETIDIVRAAITQAVGGETA